MVRRTSSAPSGEPCAFWLSCLFGLPYPMCVRTAIRLGRVVGQRGLDGRLDGGDVVAVGDPLGVPAVRVEALGDVLGEGHLRRPVELDAVVVVEDDELAQAQVAGQAGRLGGDPLLEVAVGGDDVGPVIDDRRGRGG